MDYYLAYEMYGYKVGNFPQKSDRYTLPFLVARGGVNRFFVQRSINVKRLNRAKIASDIAVIASANGIKQDSIFMLNKEPKEKKEPIASDGTKNVPLFPF